MQSPLRVAVVHEWLVNHAGSEKVTEQILKIYPDADLFSVVDFLKPGERGFIQGKRARTTFVQHLPGAQKRFRTYLPLMPLAIEQHDLSAYDLIISSSHAVAKGVLTGPDQLHVCYIHSPIRYAWDMQHQYLQESGMTRGPKGAVARLLLHYMRMWDARTPFGVDQFLANSAFIARRVRKVYRRDAEVVHPPVDVDRFTLCTQKEDFYLAASRLVPYKRMPMIVEAFAQMPDKQLVVIGDGPDMDKVRAAAGPNVTVLGFQSDESLVDHMQRARALVFAAEEDFGITPVEAQACGTPVIAFGRGGSLETVRGRPDQDAQTRTGLFFREQSAQAVADAVRAFEALPAPIRPEVCRAHAEQFAPALFRQRFRAAVEQAWARFHAPMAEGGAAMAVQASTEAAPLSPAPASPAAPPASVTGAITTPVVTPPPPRTRSQPSEPAMLTWPVITPDLVGASPAGPAEVLAKAPVPAVEAPGEWIPFIDMPLASGGSTRPLGEIIRAVRPLSDGDIDHILVVQKRMDLRFGEAAIALDLATATDVQWALSQQINQASTADTGTGTRDASVDLVALHDPSSSMSEAFRDLRSKIIASDANGGRTPLAIVSPDAGDGRTYVASNLAITFSQLGERTVLVDANLRAPGLHRVFGLKARASLSELLNGRKPPKPFDRSGTLPNLFVMQAGTPPPNPLELLQQPMFGVLLRELQREFDRVIVDTPPARHCADARVIAATCKQAVLVGRNGKTEARTMNLLVDRLRRTQAGIAGVVLNAH